MKKVMGFLAEHWELLIFAAIGLLAWTVILPTMDANDEARHAVCIAAMKE